MAVLTAEKAVELAEEVVAELVVYGAKIVVLELVVVVVDGF